MPPKLSNGELGLLESTLATFVTGVSRLAALASDDRADDAEIEQESTMLMALARNLRRELARESAPKHVERLSKLRAGFGDRCEAAMAAGADAAARLGAKRAAAAGLDSSHFAGWLAAAPAGQTSGTGARMRVARLAAADVVPDFEADLRAFASEVAQLATPARDDAPQPSGAPDGMPCARRRGLALAVACFAVVAGLALRRARGRPTISAS